MRFIFIPFLLLSAFTFFFFTGCKKEEVVTVDGNVAPPDKTIEDVTVENYVNKLYISLLGKKATETDFNAAISSLKSDDLSVESRVELIQTLFNQEAYFDNEFIIMRSSFLNNADSAEFTEAKGLIEFAKSTTSDPVQIAFWDAELVRIEPLIMLENNLKAKNKSIKESHQIVVDNFVYDEINMGTENFVVSLFQNFLLRYPTDAELMAGKNMVEGKSDALFTVIGKNKNELISLFFNTNEYYEGQVRANYLRFLYREPTNDEISLLVYKYQVSGKYQVIQEYILSTDEYLGVK